MLCKGKNFVDIIHSSILSIYSWLLINIDYMD